MNPYDLGQTANTLVEAVRAPLERKWRDHRKMIQVWHHTLLPVSCVPERAHQTSVMMFATPVHYNTHITDMDQQLSPSA